MKQAPRLSSALPRASRIAVALGLLCGLGAYGPLASATTYTWSTGTYVEGVTAPDPLAFGDTLLLVSGGTKYLSSPYTSNGTVAFQDVLYFTGGNVLTNTGTIDLQGDVGFYDGGYNGGVSNSGLFKKSAGTGTSMIQITGFSSSGTIQTDTGTLLFNSGASFGDGSVFQGAGSTVISNGASFSGSFTASNLSLSGGTFYGNASTINGALGWSGGYLTGGWTVASGQSLTLNTGGNKYLDGSLNNMGTIAATDHLYFQGGNTLTNNGLYDMQGDVGLYDGGYNGNFVNNGILRKSAGTGTSAVSIVGFSNNGTIDVQTGTLLFNAGAVFNGGSVFSGAGQVVINNGASFNGSFTTSGNLDLAGGTFSGTGVQLQGDVNWQAGTLTGDWTVAAGHTLNVNGVGVGNKYLDGSLTNNGTIAAIDNLYFQGGNTLTNNGLYDMQGDVSLYDGGYNGNFVNNGTLRKSAGVGTSAVSIVGFSNNGTIDVQSGTLLFNAGAVFNGGSVFSGAGQVVIDNGASFNGAFTTSGNLVLSGGTFSGTGAQMQGDVTWQAGTLVGDWTVVAGRTLSVANAGVGNKYLDGTLTNNGTIAATDPLYFQGGNQLTNNGLYDMQGDVGLYDGGYNGYFVNNATLRKSAGVGTSTVSITGFINKGTIEAQTGTIQFNSGGQFNDGSVFTGAGQIVINGGATFTGGFSANGNLSLAGGSFNGIGATLSTGAAAFTAGTLTGQWTVGAGTQLNVAPGAGKYLNGSLTNQGTIVATDSLYLQGGNVLSNAGRYQMQGDVGIGDGGYSGSFVNTGTLVKTAGTGTSDLSPVSVQNMGVIDVQTGSIRLPNGWTNAGTLKGTGAYITDTLTNAGHVAPGSVGSAPAALTLNGNYAQGAAGSFDVGLDGANYGSLLVSGNAGLDGTIEAVCMGACDYAVGQSWVVMTSTGSVTGTFAGAVATSGFAAGAFSVSYLPGEVVLTVTQATVAAVPEPGAWALLLLGGSLLAWRRGRTAAVSA